jgi:fructokinase
MADTTPVVVAGEALVDLTPGTTADGRAALVPVLGGAPLNVATAAARLGADVTWSGPVGSDGFGADLRARLVDEGLGADLVVDVDAPTSLAAVRLDDRGSADYVFYLDGTTLRHPDAVVPDLPDGAALVVACGALGLTDAPYGTALADALRREADVRPVWLDPNLRPSAVDDRGAYLALLDELVAGCTLVKVSDEDLAWLADGDRDTALAIARRWAGAGPALVVLTLGPDGALALRPGRDEVSVAGVPVEVVDTVGAGDTVTGALVAELQARDAVAAPGLARLTDHDVAAVLGVAAAAAGVTCTRRGADPPTRAELPRV